MTEVDRVLMHEPHRYTFLVQRDDNTVGQIVISVPPQADSYPDVTIRTDAPADGKMWVEFNCVDGTMFVDTCPDPKNFMTSRVYANSMTIHIHRIDEISGGGWDHGKHGRGQTNVIE